MDYVTESLNQYYTDDFQNTKACNVEFEKFRFPSELKNPASGSKESKSK